jgi:hypothetical protein
MVYRNRTIRESLPSILSKEGAAQPVCQHSLGPDGPLTITLIPLANTFYKVYL